MATWKRIQSEESGYLFSLSESLALVEWRNPGLLTPVDNGTMVIASDYSGQHKAASHEAYSFLVTTEAAIDSWQRRRIEFRKRWLPDGRRLSFKQLNEAVRYRALVPFLDVANEINSNVITFMIDRRIPSFMEGGSAAILECFPDCFTPSTQPSTAEKMFRVSSLLAMIISGLRREHQPSTWISDHDEALETFERREGFARLAAYVSFGLTRWSKPADNLFGTTEDKFIPDWAEDLVAIPDLFAGMYCSLSRILPTTLDRELWRQTVSGAVERDRRAHRIADWLCTARGGRLHHVLLRLDLDRTGMPRTSA